MAEARPLHSNGDANLLGRGLVVGIVQARMTSSRLPGKVMLPLPVVTEGGGVKEHPCLAVMWSRLSQSRLVDHWVVATSVDPSDDEIVAWCSENNVPCSRGALDDVLGRFAATAKVAVPRTQTDRAAVVRVTSDCPLIVPDEIDRVVATYWEEQKSYVPCGYASNIPWILGDRGCYGAPPGLDVEVMSFRALMTAARDATAQFDREHVTPFLRRDTSPTRTYFTAFGSAGDGYFRMTLDTKEDYAVLRQMTGDLTAASYGNTWDPEAEARVDTAIPEPASLRFGKVDVIKYLRAHTDLQDINLRVCGVDKCKLRRTDQLCKQCDATSSAATCHLHASGGKYKTWEGPAPGKIVLIGCKECGPDDVIEDTDGT